MSADDLRRQLDAETAACMAILLDQADHQRTERLNVAPESVITLTA